MKAIAIFLLFVGVVMIMQGYYQRKAECPAAKMSIKYATPELIDLQMAQDSMLEKQFASMFDATKPYRELSAGTYTGVDTNIPKPSLPTTGIRNPSI